MYMYRLSIIYVVCSKFNFLCYEVCACVRVFVYLCARVCTPLFKVGYSILVKFIPSIHHTVPL